MSSSLLSTAACSASRPSCAAAEGRTGRGEPSRPGGNPGRGWPRPQSRQPLTVESWSAGQRASSRFLTSRTFLLSMALMSMSGVAATD